MHLQPQNWEGRAHLWALRSEGDPISKHKVKEPLRQTSDAAPHSSLYRHMHPHAYGYTHTNMLHTVCRVLEFQHQASTTWCLLCWSRLIIKGEKSFIGQLEHCMFDYKSKSRWWRANRMLRDWIMLTGMGAGMREWRLYWFLKSEIQEVEGVCGCGCAGVCTNKAKEYVGQCTDYEC